MYLIYKYKRNILEYSGYSHTKKQTLKSGQCVWMAKNWTTKVHLCSHLSLHRVPCTGWQGTCDKGERKPWDLGVICPTCWRLKWHINLDSKVLWILLGWNLEEMKKKFNQRVYYQIRRLHLTFILIIFNVFNQHGTKLKIREEHNLFICK